MPSSGCGSSPGGAGPRANDFDRATIASGLQADALAPLIWNDEPIGVLSMGATTAEHARRLSDRLATLTEFSVMSAAVLGPMLSERGSGTCMRADVQGVIASRAFTPVFQPIVDLATGELVGYEALTRFADGKRPDLAFLAADKVGMMVQLETACLNAQIEQAKAAARGQLPEPQRLAGAGDLPDAAARRRGVGRSRRSCWRSPSTPRSTTTRASLRPWTQVRPFAMLAVDDAGAGYAGLHHILELRPQYVKLDISLVRNIDTDPARQAMVTGMTRFAESVGCALIAEGIETENELTALKLLRVEFGQGFHLARPAAIGAFAGLQGAHGGAAGVADGRRRRRRAA